MPFEVALTYLMATHEVSKIAELCLINSLDVQNCTCMHVSFTHNSLSGNISPQLGNIVSVSFRSSNLLEKEVSKGEMQNTVLF